MEPEQGGAPRDKRLKSCSVVWCNRRTALPVTLSTRGRVQWATTLLARYPFSLGEAGARDRAQAGSCLYVCKEHVVSPFSPPVCRICVPTARSPVRVCLSMCCCHPVHCAGHVREGSQG